MNDVDVLLDVDGCILAMHDQERARLADKPGWDDWTSYAPSGGWQVYSPTLIRRLAALAEQPHVTVAWCTSWRERANLVLSPLVGLPGGWPVVIREKAPDYLDRDPDRRVVWIDDDLWLDATTRDWYARSQHRAHAVVPNPWLGIRPWQMDLVERMAGADA